MRVIGIDVAPGKGGHIYEGGDRVCSKCPECLGEFLNGIQDDVLIAWDAPLTSCTDPDGPLIERDLTQRIIEAFFRSGKCGYKAPKGISVSDYSGCSHWTISRRMLGLPRTGPYDGSELPFTLIVRGDPPKTGRNIVEVHPALAFWLWFRNEQPEPYWGYKGRSGRESCGKIWRHLSSRFGSLLPEDLFANGKIPDDDELDAVSAWLLARCWLSQQNVSLVGDNQTGALLLPSDDALQQKFRDFKDKELRRRQGAGCRC